eukprot:CAMPEP_0202730966 /NCGR_PEP_ID=MMETSP1385-20130828/186906_1 /ASSEMBLY_ACC=CAM_ASM_000861 /TAXON_ID=933848 /ORGANISM="Elphidium margaritaceum" /LENGTH=1317 /DNA_ID=CAMNT_0049397247 /DNA_START=11 /DNA_END=3964 /DNA_ORIENTATION=+
MYRSGTSQPRVPTGSLRALREQQQHHTNTAAPVAAENSNLSNANNSQSQPPMNNGAPLTAATKPTDAKVRGHWKVGSKVEVYSSSKMGWFEGDITRIFVDDEGEWMEVQYACEQMMRLKQTPRDDKDAIRPLPSDLAPPQAQAPPSAAAAASFGTFHPPKGSFRKPAASTSTSSPSSSSSSSSSHSSSIAAASTGADAFMPTDTTAAAPEQSPPDDEHESPQSALDMQIRNSWVRGSRVEVYSRGRKKWMRGQVMRVFVDDEGEWLEVRYGKNLIKETPRDSPDIRPLRVRYKNRYNFTKDHENTVTSIWEEVDLENTRHLDRLLLSAVFRALNIDGNVLSAGELDDVFKWIDKEERGAVNVEEFTTFMTSSVESIQQREIQQRMFKCIDQTVTGKLSMSASLKEQEKEKLAAIYKSHFNKQVNTKGPQITSKFIPAPDTPSWSSTDNNNNNENEDGSAGDATPLAIDDTAEQQKRLLQEYFKNDNDSGDSKQQQNGDTQQQPQPPPLLQQQEQQDMGHDVIEEAEPMELDDEMAEFSDKDEDDNDEVPELLSAHHDSNNNNNGNQQPQGDGLHHRLKDVGFSDKFLVASVSSQREEYHSKIKANLDVKSDFLQQQLRNIQAYMVERVRKAGVDGLRMSELGNAVHRKFRTFDKKNFLQQKRATFSDFVSLCPGLVVVEMEGSNHRMERIAVTDSCALKINLKSKLQFVLTMLFDKGKVSNSLEPVKLERDKHGRITKTRRLSVGERLISVQDFTDRIRSLGVEFGELEGDELFWAVAGSNSTMISQKMVGRYFSGLIDHLEDPVEPEVARVLPKVIEIARLRYRREPLWKKYIVQRTISRWNNISYLRLTDRRTRLKSYDMIAIPRTRSVHGGDVLDVQKSFHYTCHILNKLQYPTICKKIDHGSDKFDFCCVTKTPHLRSFPEMLHEAMNKRNLCYSEYFISQVIGCIFETITFCHKHDTVNFNLNIDNLGFDNNLRPILCDFSRSIVLAEEDKISRFFSVMSSTPPELALLMGSNNPLMNIELNGGVLRKADSWRCGVLLYVLITGRLPYHATSLGNFITQVLTLPPTIPIEEITWVSDELKDLLYKLLETTYFNRIDLHEALKHEWFDKIGVTGKHNPVSLPTDVIDNIINLCKLENARNWISTITHKGYSENKQLERDRKYFGRLDPTGQRKALKRDKLIVFIMDRLGYCQYRANQIVDEYHEGAHTAIDWKSFVSTYIDIQWNEQDTISRTKQFANAIFRGLDPNGDGVVNSKLLLMLFEDINLKLQNVVKKLTTLQKFTFEQTVSTLTDAFKQGFDIQDLLSVDHVVQSV